VRVSDFHFDLPEDLIAQHPPAERGASRMLVMERSVVPGAPGKLRDAWFRELPEFLRAGDLLVLNDSRVRSRCGIDDWAVLLKGTASAVPYCGSSGPGL